MLKLINEIRGKLDELEKLCISESVSEVDNRPTSKVELWVDGGSKGNPGLGYCSYAFNDVMETVQLGDNITNNVAEYRGVLQGIRAVTSRIISREIDLTVHTDSALVVGQLTQGWKINAAHLKPLIAEIRARLKPFHSWSVVKSPREEIFNVLGH